MRESLQISFLDDILGLTVVADDTTGDPIEAWTICLYDRPESPRIRCPGPNSVPVSSAVSSSEELLP